MHAFSFARQKNMRKKMKFSKCQLITRLNVVCICICVCMYVFSYAAAYASSMQNICRLSRSDTRNGKWQKKKKHTIGARMMPGKTRWLASDLNILLERICVIINSANAKNHY